MKQISHLFVASVMVLSLFSTANCRNSSALPDKVATSVESETIMENGHYIVKERHVFINDSFPQESSFIVVSKKYLDLSVYANVKGDTLLIARYPVCLSRAKGQKQKKGDMKTPESWPGEPFVITQIQPASTWKHDFGDGRGSIKSYGDWFLRLRTPGHSGIGIHGSTNNEHTVPGRDSEGCIRLRDADIIHLKENYAWVGMPVIIKQEDQEDFPFEAKP